MIPSVSFLWNTVVPKLFERTLRALFTGFSQLFGRDSIGSTVINRVGGAILPDEWEVTVENETHRFHLSTFHEFNQFKAYDSDVDSTVLRQFAADLDPEDVVWDVGANVGVFTVTATATCPPDQVIAIEPYPSNVSRIHENLELNGQSAVVKQLALADKNETAAFTVSSPDGAGAFGIINGQDAAETFLVETHRGDDLIRDGCPVPTILKIDIQGSELAALRGLRDVLSEIEIIYCNVYEKHYSSEVEAIQIRTILEEAGFEYERIGEWDGGYFLRATRGE